MKREELTEVHYIAHINNLASIAKYGILCRRKAKGKEKSTIANEEIISTRARKRVPKGRNLHEYANLFLNARNPMLYSIKEAHNEICVLSISTEVLDLPGVVITDMNAARILARFNGVEEGLASLDKGKLFAISWKHHGDLHREEEHKGIMMAEVLVPNYVPPDYLQALYVNSDETRAAVEALGLKLPVTVRRDLFFS